MKRNLRKAEMRPSKKQTTILGPDPHSWFRFFVVSKKPSKSTKPPRLYFFLFFPLSWTRWVGFFCNQEVWTTGFFIEAPAQSWETCQAPAELGGQVEGCQGFEGIVSFSVGSSTSQCVIFCDSDLTIIDIFLDPTPTPIQVNTATVAILQHSQNFISSHALPSEEPPGHFCLGGDRNKLKALLQWIQLVFGYLPLVPLLGGRRGYYRDSPTSVSRTLPLWFLTLSHTTYDFVNILKNILFKLCLCSPTIFIKDTMGLLCVLYFSNIH